VLDKADDLRGKRRQALATLDTLSNPSSSHVRRPLTNSKGWPKAELQSITRCHHRLPPHDAAMDRERRPSRSERRTSDMASGNGMTPGMLMKLNTSNGQSAASWRLATLS